MALRDLEVGALPLPDWRRGLPEITGERAILRELRPSDALALHRVASIPEISRHIWPPPPTVAGVEQFIEWTFARRARGEYICFAIIPRPGTELAGMFELRSCHSGLIRVELGFFLDPACWGTGVFSEAARLVCAFAFDVLGVHRIEARASAENPRGNAALRKMGARKEGRLRAAFVSGGREIDQYLWAIVNDGRQAAYVPANNPAASVADSEQ